MKTAFAFLRISLGLTSLTLCVLLVAVALGLVPDADRAVLQGRMSMAEAVAIHCSVTAQRNDMQGLEAAFRAELDHDAELASVALWSPHGKLIAAAGDPGDYPADGVDGHSTPTDVRVPVALAGNEWGLLNLQFHSSPWVDWGGIGVQTLLLIGFITAGCCAVHGAFLWRALRKARKVDEEAVPKRVRAALNTLAEGVLILDRDQRIALSNEAFAQLVNKPVRELEGQRASDLSWTPRAGAPDDTLPWDAAAARAMPQLGVVLRLADQSSEAHTVSVNTAPVIADDGSWRGTLATFDDLTHLHKKNNAMKRLLVRLKRSRAEIQRRNQELRELATRDPLTACLNRRAFFTQADSLWSSSPPIGCIMVDIDHFKLINDRHGHAAGDQVLQAVGAALKANARSDDLVCRYGGEEFCVLLPQVTLEEAESTAERFRIALEAAQPASLPITASFGVATTDLGARDPHELIDQADKALYYSKRTGRNRVARYDRLPVDFMIRSADKAPSARSAPPATPIPFPAVSALLSALAYRDVDTAEHSLRVADLCVTAAKGLLSRSQCYVLEVAALLHDIGKLGIPDAVLKKPGPLTAEEWKVIRTHESIGEEILTAAFMSDELTAITRNHHALYGGSPHDVSLPVGEAIPLGARLLSIADAFDAMVSDRCYRRGCGHAKAFAELRRCGGVQFDPDLVEHFIAIVEAREQRSAAAVHLSKQTALRVGLQMETLAAALDAKDRQTLTAMLGQLGALARDNGIPDIGTRAAGLQEAVASGADWLELASDALDLMDLCRASYDSYLPDRSRAKQPAALPALAGTSAS
jgi:diguanylate cyclase (GGDEF)-like protein/putative nucleotidyltransferase with HDIG domain